MLYERWLKVAESRAGDVALRELATGRDWTFARLTDESEAAAPAPGRIAFPRGRTADFIITVLRGWRLGQVVCPLEPEQPEPAVAPPPSWCVHLKTTSATTGAPRMVAFSEEQLAADADNLVETMGLRPDWPNLGLISLAHSYGFSNLVTPLLLHGIPLIISDSTLPERIRSAGRWAPALTVPAVPALWRAWHDAAAIPDCVRLAISAGAPMPLQLERSIFDTVGLKVHNFYGASECGGIAYDGSSVPRSEQDEIGPAVRNVSLSVGDDGCLEVRGPAVGETYWPQASPELGGGRFVTSDLAEIKKDIVSIKGRIGDRINVAGRKIEPDVVEDAVRGFPGIKECLVFGCPDGTHGRAESIVAVVQAAASIDRGALRDFLLERLPAWQVPRHWWFVDSLGPDDRGKMSRAAWRRNYLTNRDRL